MVQNDVFLEALHQESVDADKTNSVDEESNLRCTAGC